MPSRRAHYEEAERLLAKGVEAVAKISNVHDLREGLVQKWTEGEVGIGFLTPQQNETVRALTAKMDEYGKQAMGIWAQAQVHATLATASRDAAND